MYAQLVIKFIADFLMAEASTSRSQENHIYNIIFNQRNFTILSSADQLFHVGELSSKLCREAFMKAKILLILIVAVLCSFSYSLGYGYGSSNMGYYYPSFDGYLSYDPSAEELGRYIDEAKEYVNNCNADIELIIEARNRAINDANDAINNYNLYH